MKNALLLLAALTAVPAPRAFAQAQAGMINLSCVESLVAVGQPQLAGVFSFINENDTPSAFADLMVHDKKLMKKWIKKLQKDLKDANGISTWDHNAIAFALQIYESPLAETLEKPGDLKDTLLQLGKAPTITLAELTARRKKS